MGQFLNTLNLRHVTYKSKLLL